MRKYRFTINTDLPKTIPLLLRSRVLEHPEINLQAAKNKAGKYEFFTYADVYEKIIAFAHSIRKLGITRGSNVALISDNRKEWLVADFAIQSLGGADVPRGCDSAAPEIRYIINFAECTVGIFENEKQLLKVLEKTEEAPNLKKAIMFDDAGNDVKAKAADAGVEVYSFSDLLEEGMREYKDSPDAIRAQIEAEMEKTGTHETATIIFTSGTTGTPKGVMLSHSNYISQLSSVHNFMPEKKGQWWMSILPVWHSFERLAQYVTILLHSGLSYSKPVARTLLADLAEINPRWMCGVPRLWDALAGGVEKTMQKTGGITYKLYRFFMKVGVSYAEARDLITQNIISQKPRNDFLDFMRGIIPFLALWPLRMLGDVLVYRKIRAKFGNRFAFAVSGGGALQKETDNFFRAINLTMVEGYGMTETAPSIAFRDWRNPQPNCVGTVFPTVEVKIAGENGGQPVVDGKFSKSAQPLPYGEKGLIMVRGGHVMKGYYNRPDLTAKIIDEEGWLNTGDMGYMTKEGVLKITGRAKDTIVLLDGENIEPVGIEQALCSSEYIESAMVVGQDKKYLSSLIVPRKEAVERFARENNIIFENYETLLQNELVKKLMNDVINTLVSVDRGFKTCERVARFRLISRTFEVGKELSAKLEMMRHKISEEYHEEIEEMYA